MCPTLFDVLLKLLTSQGVSQTISPSSGDPMVALQLLFWIFLLAVVGAMSWEEGLGGMVNVDRCTLEC